MYRFTLLLSFTFASFCVNAYAQIYTPPKNIQLKLYNNDPNQIHVNIKPDNNNDNNENTLYYNVSYYSLNKGIGTESWFDNAAVGITCNSNHLKGSNSCDIGFLYDRFNGGAEAWEVHEIVRKTFLTGVIVFIQDPVLQACK